MLLGVHRTTVVRKFRYMAEQCRMAQEKWLRRFEKSPLKEVYFDEMETFEHSKLKPLSVPLAVSFERYILDVGVAEMPAKGLLAEKSRKKYGKRKDERPRALRRMLRKIASMTEPNAILHSDQN